MHNKGWYLCRVVVGYNYPVAYIYPNGSAYVVDEWRQSETQIELNKDYTFRVPYNVDPTTIRVKANAVAGVDIFTWQVTQTPTCFHTWGVTLIPAWSVMPCWNSCC